MSYKIRICFEDYGNGEIPCAIDVVDEYTEDINGGDPDSYRRDYGNPSHRELVIDIPESAVLALFETPTVKAKVTSVEAD